VIERYGDWGSWETFDVLDAAYKSDHDLAHFVVETIHFAGRFP